MRTKRNEPRNRAVRTALAGLIFVSVTAGQTAAPLQRAQDLINQAQTAYFQNHDAAGARRLLDDAVSACTGGKDTACEATVQINRGAFLKIIGQYQDALEAYSQVIEIRTRAGNDHDTAEALALRAAVFQDEAQWQRALDDYSRAREVYAATGDPAGTAHAAALAGYCLEQLNRPDEAISYYSEALRTWPENSPDTNRTSAFLQLGGLYGREGKVQDAIANFDRGIATADRLGDPAVRIDARLATGVYRRSIGDYKSAQSLYNQALQLAVDSNRAADVARARNDSGLLAAVTGDYATAERLLRQALESMQGAQRATTLNNLAGVLDHTGRFDEALKDFSEALDIDTKTGDKKGIVTVENNLGELNIRLGRIPEAVRHYKAAASLGGQIGDLAGEATALSNLGSTYDDLQDFSSARDVLQQALDIRERLGDKPGQAATLNAIGSVDSNRKDNPKALTVFEYVRDLRSAMGDNDGLAAAWNNIGAVYDRMGEFAKAEEALDNAFSVWENVNDSAGESSVYVNLASVRTHQNRLDDALTYYLMALDRMEKLRSASVVDEFRSGIAASASGVYASAVGLYMQQRRYREAFEMAERARARAYLDELMRSRGSAHLPPAPPELTAKAETLQQEISALEQTTRTTTSSEAQQQLNEARQEQRELRVLIEAESRGTTSDLLGKPATLAEVQQAVPADTTLISYFGTAERIYIFLVTRNSFHAIASPDAGTAVRDAAREYLAFATEDSGNEAMSLLAKNLSKPIEGKIKTRRICIAPHRFLHGFPFAALPFENGYLNSNHSLYYTPSPSVLVRLVRPPEPKGGIAVFAQDRLPGAAKLQHASDEAKQIATAYSVVPDLDASETDVRAALGRFGTVHIAAHAEVDSTAQLSRIYLRADDRNDGLLEFDEIMNSDYTGSNLVVLSACNTNLGPGTTGDELQSLSRALLFAGVRTVVASLWQVDDELTSELMSRFYAELRGGATKIEALNRAQSAIRRKNPNPYYWAAFVLVGGPDRLGK